MLFGLHLDYCSWPSDRPSLGLFQCWSFTITNTLEYHDALGTPLHNLYFLCCYSSLVSTIGYQTHSRQLIHALCMAPHYVHFKFKYFTWGMQSYAIFFVSISFFFLVFRYQHCSPITWIVLVLIIHHHPLTPIHITIAHQCPHLPSGTQSYLVSLGDTCPWFYWVHFHQTRQQHCSCGSPATPSPPHYS